ncbi:MAG: hypothetical protein ACXVY8_10260 [Gaiellaceae bacterium]
MFAIAITLLVLEISVPERATSTTSGRASWTSGRRTWGT